MADKGYAAANASTAPAAAHKKERTDVEAAGAAPEGFGKSFTDASIRAAFVRKVYAILLIQLVITTVFVALACFLPAVKNFYCDITEYDAKNGLLHCVQVRFLIFCHYRICIHHDSFLGL